VFEFDEGGAETPGLDAPWVEEAGAALAEFEGLTATCAWETGADVAVVEEPEPLDWGEVGVPVGADPDAEEKRGVPVSHVTAPPQPSPGAGVPSHVHASLCVWGTPMA